MSKELMDSSRFRDWMNNKATEEDKKLYERIQDLSELFEDMIFEKGTSVDSFIHCQYKNKSGKLVDDVLPMPEVMENFSLTYFTYYVKELPKQYGGGFDSKELELWIIPKYAEMDDVILHEMIHLYECILEQVPQFYHDILIWALYIELRKKIDNIDQLISDFAHLLNEQDLYSKGGLHDILFLLKSLDLDIRKGYSLGTVMGYEFEKSWEGYTYRI